MWQHTIPHAEPVMSEIRAGHNANVMDEFASMCIDDQVEIVSWSALLNRIKK